MFKNKTILTWVCISCQQNREIKTILINGLTKGCHQTYQSNKWIQNKLRWRTKFDKSELGGTMSITHEALSQTDIQTLILLAPRKKKQLLKSVCQI